MTLPRRRTLVLTAVLAWLAGASAFAAEPPLAERYLQEGRLAEGERSLAEALKAAPDDDQARFGLGVIQFLRAVEARVQGFHRHGLRSDLGGGLSPLTNLPIPPNPGPKPLDAKGLRAMLRGWVDDLGKAEATLAGVKAADVKLPIHFGLVRLDFDGDGTAGDGETLWKVYARFNRNAGAGAARDFVIAFDRGDVDWLRGYCHLLMAVGEVVLAHDFDDLFRETGYLFFRGARPPLPFLTNTQSGRAFDLGEILDLVATIHLMRLSVTEPARLTSALVHIEATARLSRSSWKAILAETDDDREWVPNPKQGTVVPSGKVTPEMVQGWFDFLDEFESILAGRKLLPFWRGSNPRLGINLRKVFTEPRAFDLVLWVRGTAAAPYLQEGEVTSPETWRRLNRVFRGEFIGFAMWFN